MSRPVYVFGGTLKWSIALIVMFCACFPSAQGNTQVQIAWDPNPEPTVIGYNIYWGPWQGSDTNVIDVGATTDNSSSVFVIEKKLAKNSSSGTFSNEDGGSL